MNITAGTSIHGAGIRFFIYSLFLFELNERTGYSSTIGMYRLEIVRYMSDITLAQIRVVSRVDGEDVVQEMPAELILKGTTLYVRYEEPEVSPQGGAPRTTIKITPNQVKIIRHGEVQSEHSFQREKRLPGFYRSPFTTFNLSTYTTDMDIEIEGMYGHVRFAYDLYVFDDQSGQFAIHLHIQEELQS